MNFDKPRPIKMSPAQVVVRGQDKPFALVRKNCSCKVHFLPIYGRGMNAIQKNCDGKRVIIYKEWENNYHVC